MRHVFVWHANVILSVARRRRFISGCHCDMGKIKSRLRRFDWNIIIILLLPWLLLAANENWIYSPPGTDQWLYHGYFHFFGQYLKLYDIYWGARLPWILPGYLCYSIFPPLVANYVLHLGFYYAAIFSLYFILKSVYSSRAGMVTALLMGCYPFFLSAIGSDYVDGAGMTYFLLSLLFLTLSNRGNWAEFQTAAGASGMHGANSLPAAQSLALAAAGMATAAMLYTNFFLVIFMPLLLFYYLALYKSWSRRRLSVGLAIVGAGFIFLTLALGAASYAAGGKFPFFLSQFGFARYVIGKAHLWWNLGASWLGQATWLVYPVIIFITSIISLLLSMRGNRHKERRRSGVTSFIPSAVFNLCYVFLFAVMLVMQLCRAPVLQANYYASYLIPGMFLAFGSQIHRWVERLNTRQYLLLLSLLFPLLLLAYAGGVNRVIGKALAGAGACYLISIIIACVSGIALIRAQVNSDKVRYGMLMSGMFFLCLANCLAVAGMDFARDDNRKNYFLATQKSISVIKPYNPDHALLFWASADDRQINFIQPITMVHFPWRLVNIKLASPDGYLPSPAEKESARALTGKSVVIIASDRATIARAESTLNLLGLTAESIAEEQIRQNSTELVLYFVRSRENAGSVR